MSSVSRTVSGQTPMRGMIEEQSVQSASVKGSVSSSESVIDASNMSSVSIVKEGSESSGMSELVDRMLKYQPPPNLTAEMGKTVDDVIKYMKSTAELLRFLMNSRKKFSFSSSFSALLTSEQNLAKISRNIITRKFSNIWRKIGNI